MAAKTDSSLNRTFLLRAWCEDSSGGWRVMVQRAGSSERNGFPDLLAAFAFIEEELIEEELAALLEGDRGATSE